MIFSENRFPLFGIMLEASINGTKHGRISSAIWPDAGRIGPLVFGMSMIFSENRFPLFGIML
jgi:hypothetical protein